MDAPLNFDKALEGLKEIPEEILQRISFVMPWQHDPDSGSHVDPDGFSPMLDVSGKEDSSTVRNLLQGVCWNKFQRNPQINTSVRGQMGRLTGFGFETTSGEWKVQQVIEEIEEDPRNRLYNFWPKYVGRSFVEGELFLGLTLHENGFVEVDFIDPYTIGKGGTEDSGIIFHSRKTTMPLFYNVDFDGNGNWEQIPSIFIGRYPSLVENAASQKLMDGMYERKRQKNSRSLKHVFRKFGGYRRFIIAWDKGLITKRAVSYLRTTIQWLNHYENLKKYEIDHKKSSGAYAWVFQFEDVKAFQIWLALTDDERKKTGIAQKMVPGSKIVLPPGMTVTAVNPNLTSIRDQDTDILQMVTSGLNESSDITTGTASGSFSSVKATRGPMSDRTADEIAYFERFLRFDFWGSIFFLKSAIDKFPEYLRINKAVDWEKQEPVFKLINTRPEKLIEFSFPKSETIDNEGRARAFLGVKHGPVSETLGIPNKTVSENMGLGGYSKARLDKATEDDKYPELVYTADAESLQETIEGEPKKTPKEPVKKPVKKEVK